MKKLISLLLSICFILSMAAVMPMDSFISANAALSVSGGTLNSATFILDPGHGGSDPGACLGSRAEANDVLRLSLRIAQLINANGSSAALTRVTDATQSLATKVSIANSGSFSYFVSVHRNAGGGTGIENYYYSGLSSTSTGAKLCTSIHNSMVNSGVWTKNRGIKTAAYYVIKNTSMAACLLEVGFIDSATDNSIFDNHFETIAVSIANGMLAMVGKSVSSTSSTKYQSCLDDPSGGSKTNGSISASATVTQTGGADTLAVKGWTLHSDGISSVRYKVDSGSWTNFSTTLREDVKAAISGYSSYANCGFSGNVAYGKLSGGSHTVTIQAVTSKSATYTVATIALTVKDPISPTVSNPKMTNLTTGGYRVSCTVSDNAGVTSVKFPTWTDAGGQDDLVWHEGIISGNTAYYDVKVSEHGNSQDLYHTHIYVYDGAGNQASSNIPSVNLKKDTTAPSISNYSISNVDYWGFDVSCKISDDIGVTKVQFPTWTDASGQDDIKWYNVSVSGGTATLHVNTADHSYQTGAYNVHLYAWDLWNNETCVNLAVNVPTPVYPTDADYIPLSAINGDASLADAQVWTTGTYSAEKGVIVLEKTSTGYAVAAKYEAGTAKSVTATADKPIIIASSVSNVQVGAEASLEGVNLSTGKVLAKAHLKLPLAFALTDGSGYSLDDKYVTAESSLVTADDISAQFKCLVKIFSASGEELAENAIGGTGCVVKQISSAGTVLHSATLVVPGDLNGDGDVSSVDIIGAKSAVKASVVLTGAYHKAMDLDGDGESTSIDYTLIKLNCIKK